MGTRQKKAWFPKWPLALGTAVGIAVSSGCGAGLEDGGGPDLSETGEAVASGHGLTANYYEGQSFDTLFKTRVDGQVGFDWVKGAPMSGMTVDNFSVRWTGFLKAPSTGSYTFTTTSDDGVRLWVNGQKVIDDWAVHAAKDDSGSLSLTKGVYYPVKLEYFEGGGKAVAKLSWTPPGGAKALIPSSALFTSAPAPAPSGISVSGNHLTRDGQPWLPKGLSMIGALTCGAANKAYDHWGQAEIDAAKSWGADAFRFQVSQPTLDPQDAHYSASYLARLQAMVALAESNGFAVILSMQDQSLACGDATPTPTAATQRAWAQLGPVFKDDARVVYELYNEPQTGPDSAGWTKWKSGGGGAVGHQALVTQLRNLGAQNVLLADGANYSEILTDVPLLDDPLHKLGYAFHPYYLTTLSQVPGSWDKRFGNLSQTQPVVATEWNESTVVHADGSGCHADDAALTQKLLPYLTAHGIGIFGWGFDFPQAQLVKDWTWAPTSLTPWVCGQGDNGAGEALRDHFLSQAPPATGPKVILTSGDFSAASKTHDLVQAELAQLPDAALLPMGDLSYGDVSTATDPYLASYPWNESDWVGRTFPVMGNHEFNAVSGKGGQEPYALFNGHNAAGNRTFAAITGDNGVDTYDFTYAYEVTPGWLLVVVNSGVKFKTQNVDAQAAHLAQWIDDWRAQHGGHGCVAIAMHTARWSTTFSGYSDNDPTWYQGTQPIWAAALAHHADLLLQGHVHAYEEFAKLDLDGNVSSDGVKVFTAGSGGRGQVKNDGSQWPPNNLPLSRRLDFHASPADGVLKLALYPGGYGYQFETSATPGVVPPLTVSCNVP